MASQGSGGFRVAGHAGDAKGEVGRSASRETVYATTSLTSADASAHDLARRFGGRRAGQPELGVGGADQPDPPVGTNSRSRFACSRWVTVVCV
jgi:hypothetical protein